jgi:hypothetical protein
MILRFERQKGSFPGSPFNYAGAASDFFTKTKSWLYRLFFISPSVKSFFTLAEHFFLNVKKMAA